MPDLTLKALSGNKHAQAYYGTFKLELGDDFVVLEEDKNAQ